MVYYEVGFKLQHDCPLLTFSRKYPGMTLALWCNFDKDVLEITYDDLEGNQELMRDLESLYPALGGPPIHQVITGSSAQLITDKCDCLTLKWSTSRAVEHNNCLMMDPTIWAKGWEWYRIIAFSERDVRGLFNDLDKFCDVEVTSKQIVREGSIRDTFVISTSNLLGKLTRKQKEALMLALDNGYYGVPKKATTKEIAEKMGLPRTTFDERLRKAESKVLQSIGPHIQLSGRARKKDQLLAAQITAE